MNEQDYCIVTILDTISETSMPLNEFVLYRLKKYPRIKQYVIVCDKKENSKMLLPDNLKVFYIESDRDLLKKQFKWILSKNKESKLKTIVHLHQIKAALLFYRATWSLRRAYKILFTVHSVYALRNLKYKVSSTFCALMADKTTCVSESSYRTYSPFAKFCKKKDICVVQNGVDIERIDKVLFEQKNEKNGVKKNYKTLVYVGRLIPIKNQKFLIDIFNKLDDCRLIFIGAESENKEITKLVHTMGLEDRVKITGMIPRNEVFKILTNADVYISSSKVEGLPVSVLEAMVVGLPVILSNIEPHKEIAVKSENIKLLPLENKNDWINTINRYLKLDCSELENIGLECRKCAMDYFSLSKMHDNYDRVYEILL